MCSLILQVTSAVKCSYDVVMKILDIVCYTPWRACRAQLWT